MELKYEFGTFQERIGQVSPGAQAVRHDQAERRPPRARQLTLATRRRRYAVRNTGAGGCDGLTSANATCTMPPAKPSATPMRQAMV